MNPLGHCGPTDRFAARRGVAALFVLICLSFATVVGTLLLQAVVAERAYVSRLALTHQAEWLVEAGVDRAVARLDRSSRYTGETWPISTVQLGPARTAIVHIEIKRDPSDPEEARRVHVAADLQEGNARTVKATKELIVMISQD